MSKADLISSFEQVKKNFWNERQNLQQDDIKLQWAAEAATYANILFNTEVQTLPLELTSAQGAQMARQSTSRSWAESPVRRRGSDIVTSAGLGQHYSEALASQPMSRKRARTSQCEPANTAKNAISAPSLDTNLWQRDSNPPNYGYTNTSASGHSFKARRTSAGRMPIKISEGSANIRVYEPAEYLQHSGAFPLPCSPLNTRPQSNFNQHYTPSNSLEVPSSFSVSPTTTISERFTNTTPSTSVAMSREDSLATSFCGAFGMIRASSGISEIDLGQHMYRQDSCHSPSHASLTPNGQEISMPFDSSIYFAHAEGMGIEDSSTSTLAVEPLYLPTASELDMELKGDVLSPTLTVEQAQSPSSPTFDTRMIRNASTESNVSSISRISRRSQEQVAQAARPIAPKDVPESSIPRHSSSLSGGQDMLRQRSAPEPKVLIPKLQYNRQAKEKLKCERCNKNPDGYRGSHELHRHMALDHNTSRTAWVCVDISSDGFLSGCAACESQKPYGQDYNAAAHLRRFHFHPKSEIRRTNVDPEERRGGKGGGKDPPMSECRRWMRKIQVPGKDYVALADSSGNDAADDVAGEDEEYKQEHGEHDAVLGGSSLPGNVQTNGEAWQSHNPAVDQQMSAPLIEGSNSLEQAMNDDRHSTIQTSDVPFSRSSPQPAFEMPFEYLDLAHSCSTLSPSAPAARCCLSNNLADLAEAGNSFVNCASNQLDPSSSTSNTRSPRTLEDFSDFQTSYVPDNVPYGMFSPNNPHVPYGLLNFPPFR